MTVPRRIAVGFDGSPDSVAALRWAAGLASATGAELRVVHAIGMLEHAGVSGSAGLEEQARRFAVEAGSAPELVRWRAVDGEPCSVLRREAAGATGADLLVVGTRGTGAHRRELLGSTSLELAEQAPVPVVIVPASPGAG